LVSQFTTTDMLYVLTQEELDKLKADRTGEEEIKKKVNAKLDGFSVSILEVFRRHRVIDHAFLTPRLMEDLREVFKDYKS